MIHALLRCLTAPSTLAKLEALATGAPGAAPVSLRLPLGCGDTDWLNLLPADTPYWYRARPDQQEYRLAIGHALHVTSAGPNRFAALDNAFAGFCRDWRRNGPAYAFAGFAFAADNHAPLPNALLAIPSILLETVASECWVTLSTPAGRLADAITEWPKLLANASPAHLPQQRGERPEGLAEQAWLARVKAALRDIDGGRVAKIVLSRRRTIEADGPFPACRVLGQLVRQQPSSLVYAYGNGQQHFLGATPERLIRLVDQRIDADALAGTSWPGSLALSAGKNRHEQALVVEAVCAALLPFCDQPPTIGLASEHAAGHLHHLRSRISAKVGPDTTLLDLVRALHPTPAIGGFPVLAAQAWLAEHKEQRSGWYSGGIGLLNASGDGEFSVALRSALLDGHTAKLHAGAGIVAGSDALQELAETNAKLDTMLNALSPASRLESGDSRRA
ncbi:isochorismate synthase MenF [Dechloromonas sp. HYN0024]|uniref:isochorismate synthase n=1 Tax=Dechloromonas sp. HYN0024 TaxID=2231055 RepID=UPI0013C31D52|nr:isochorismate synthase [Dechloromonas sp. HYN0024]